MNDKLIIVESPTKARTISNYLGKGFDTLATYGHVRDLAKKKAVNPEERFHMNYEPIEEKKKYIDAIVRKLKHCKVCYMATDPDREGEAIAWHLLELLRERKALKDCTVHRVVFYEITQDAVRQAIENPREISTHLVEAQQARRALDYLVGFHLSPLLWRKIFNGLSAGRVQSPALRLICEREKEINAFVQQEYWQIDAHLNAHGKDFAAHLTHFEGQRLGKLSIQNQQQAADICTAIERAANGSLHIQTLKKQLRNRRPAPPYTTSTMQQDAVKRLGMGTSRTMVVAQQLYEGINIDGQSRGLITYMRTDSVTLAQSALNQIRTVIGQHYGQDSVPERPNYYKSNARNAQEAHEAIRPSYPDLDPEQIRSALSHEQYKLYDMIWRRTIASQMPNAVYELLMIDLAAGDTALFRASASTLVKPGFTQVYQQESGESTNLLPPVKQGENLPLTAIKKHQHFTEPPPRLNEASLVKALESYGIGRPSTYASIVKTLVDREYVTLENRRFKPSERGETVNAFLTEHFNPYTDYDFTSDLESKLDSVAKSQLKHMDLMQEFWKPFKQRIDEKSDNVQRNDTLSLRTVGTDAKTGQPLYLKRSRYGLYVQVGEKPEDRNKKATFVGIPKGIDADDVTPELVERLRKLPRTLGEHPDYGTLKANNGPYGPYVEYQNQAGKRQFASISQPDDVYSIDFERACTLVEEKIQQAKNRTILNFEGSTIQVLKGRYGPYISDGRTHAKIPKGCEPEQLTLERCQQELETAKNKPKRRFVRRKK